MHTLLIGASGQLGSALATAFRDKGDLVRTGHAHTAGSDIQMDLADERQIDRVIDDTRPNLIIVAGAMCNVDGCELDPRRCRLVNTAGPARLAEHARERGAFLVFYSTDHVFDGFRPDPYREDDSKDPLSEYARSKLAAEEAIRAALPNRHLILRTGWLYGPDLQHKNFALRLVSRLQAGELVKVPADQAGCPTFTDDLAAATRTLVDRGCTGTFHAVGPDFLDRVTLARAICRAFGVAATGVQPCLTSELGQAARRSLEVRLSCERLASYLATPFRGVDAGLSALAAWAHAAQSA